MKGMKDGGGEDDWEEGRREVVRMAERKEGEW